MEKVAAATPVGPILALFNAIFNTGPSEVERATERLSGELKAIGSTLTSKMECMTKLIKDGNRSNRQLLIGQEEIKHLIKDSTAKIIRTMKNEFRELTEEIISLFCIGRVTEEEKTVGKLAKFFTKYITATKNLHGTSS